MTRLAAGESYPEELKYHREHDWARIEGDEATLGVTWFAQDALGELVHFEAPTEGELGDEGRLLRRGRVGQGRLGRDRAALGRDPRGEPEGRRRARDGERGSLRRGLAGPDPAVRPGRGRLAARRRGVQAAPRRARSGQPALPHRRRSRGDARGDRRLVGRGALPRHPGGRALPGRRSTSSRRSPSPSSSATWRSSRRGTSTRRRSSRSSARASTTTTCRRSSTPCSSAASS